MLFQLTLEQGSVICPNIYYNNMPVMPHTSEMLDQATKGVIFAFGKYNFLIIFLFNLSFSLRMNLEEGN